MSRSFRKIPVSTIACCKSQKAGKVAANRRFRRIVRQLIKCGRETLPVKNRDITNPYNLGGDGKRYYHRGFKRYEKIFRK